MLNQAEGRREGAVDQGRRAGQCREAVVDEFRILAVQGQPGDAHQSLERILVEAGGAVGEAKDVADPAGRVGGQPVGQPLGVRPRQRHGVGRYRLGDQSQPGRVGQGRQARDLIGLGFAVVDLGSVLVRD